MKKAIVDYNTMRPIKGPSRIGELDRQGRPLAYEGAGRMTVHKAIWMHEALDKQLKEEAKKAGVKVQDWMRKKLAAK